MLLPEEALDAALEAALEEEPPFPLDVEAAEAAAAAAAEEEDC